MYIYNQKFVRLQKNARLLVAYRACSYHFCPVRRGVGVMGIRGSPKHPFCYFFQKRWKIDKL